MKNNLDKYNIKRNFRKTKEPVGEIKKTRNKLHFVVQHHLARKDHYDLRLEWNGVLKSWAIPKGPSYNSKDKRLAIQVEDHPISYRNFEGTIPKGEYGGGTVMLWDQGYWEPFGYVDFVKGPLKFVLKGSRLRGTWTLVKFKENWLLIKENDGIVGYKKIEQYNTSIISGRKMEEIEQNIKTDKKNIVSSITITHPDKVIYSKAKIKKIDIVNYYSQVADAMLPFLNNRLISTVRCPEGIENDCFFKKHLGNSCPGIGKKYLPNDKGKKEDYYYIKDKVGLISEVQMNSVEFHIWGSKAKEINKPDMMVFDLDPDEGLSLEKIRLGVKDLKSILDDLGLISFLKTSGGKGYHVVVPITSIKSWKKHREVAKNIAKLMEEKWPEKYVSNVRKEKRKGKIFIDWLRNTKGSTSVAPYSLRTRDNATVSMPISWNELDKIKPDEVTIDMALKRLKRKDPWKDFWQINQ